MTSLLAFDADLAMKKVPPGPWAVRDVPKVASVAPGVPTWAPATQWEVYSLSSGQHVCKVDRREVADLIVMIPEFILGQVSRRHINAPRNDV